MTSAIAALSLPSCIIVPPSAGAGAVRPPPRYSFSGSTLRVRLPVEATVMGASIAAERELVRRGYTISKLDRTADFAYITAKAPDHRLVHKITCRAQREADAVYFDFRPFPGDEEFSRSFMAGVLYRLGL